MKNDQCLIVAIYWLIITGIKYGYRTQHSRFESEALDLLNTCYITHWFSTLCKKSLYEIISIWKEISIGNYLTWVSSLIETDSFHSDKLNNSKHVVYGKFIPLSPRLKKIIEINYFMLATRTAQVPHKKRGSVFPSRSTPTLISLGEREHSFLPNKR